MAYKKYIKRNGKTYGPYIYHSRKVDGKVITEYHGKHVPQNKLFILGIFSFLLFTFLLGGYFFTHSESLNTLKNVGLKSISSITGFTIFENQTYNETNGQTKEIEAFNENLLSKFYNKFLTLFTEKIYSFITGFVTDEETSEDAEELETIEEPEDIVSDEEIETEATEIVEEQEEETEDIIEIEENETVVEEEKIKKQKKNKTNETKIIIEESANETILEENQTIEENATISNETQLGGITEQNESTFNDSIEEVLTNKTIVEESQTILPKPVLTKRAKIIIGRPVKWVKSVDINKNKILELPKEAKNISILIGGEVQEAFNEIEEYELIVEEADRKDLSGGRITGLVSSDISKSEGIFIRFLKWIKGFNISGKVISEEEIQEDIIETDNSTIINLENIVGIENETEIAVEYYTEAPLAFEEDTDKGKIITISAPDELEYEDILAYTELSGEAPKEFIKLYHLTDISRTLVEVDMYDLNNNSLIDYVEWIVPHLSNQTYELIIEITKAEHLDSNRGFLSDIYEEVKELDDIWSKTINDAEYVRVTFEIPLDSSRDITLYPRTISGSPRIEVYEFNQSELITEFTSLNDNEYNKVFLTNLIGEQDTFDLRVVGGSVEFDHIIDPDEILYVDALDTTYIDWTTSGTIPFLGDNVDEVNTAANNVQHGIWDFANSTGSGDFDVILYLETQQDGTNEDVEVYIANSTGVFTLEGTISPPATYGFDTINLTLKLSTFAEIDAARMYIIYSKGGPAGLVHVRRAYLNVTTAADTTPPTITIDSPTNTTFSTGDIDYNITLNEALDFAFASVDSGSNFTLDNDSNTHYFNISGNHPTLSDGFHNITFWVNDTFGNANESTVFFTVDTTNPLITYNAATEANNSNFARDYVYVNVTVTETNEDTITFTLFNSTSEVNTTIYTSAIRFINFTGLPDEIYTYNVTVNDTVGNSNTTETRFITLDTTNPLIAFIAPTETNGTSKSQNWIFANVSVTEANFVNITYLLQNASGIVNETTYTTLVNSINWTNLNQSSVDYFYNVTIVDLLNNENSTETRTLTLITADTTPPTITIDSPTNTTFAIGDIDYNITLNENLHTAFYSVDSGSNLSLDNDSNTHYFNISGNHPTLSDGFHNITFWVNDTSGNGNESTVFFSVDTTAPNVQFETPTTAIGNFSQTFIEANVTASDSTSGLDTITIYLYNSTALVQTNTSITSPLFVNFTGLPDETYTLNSTANDTIGNTNQTETRTILLDTVNPAVILFEPQAINYTTTSLTVNFSAIDTNLDTCWYTDDGGVTNNTLANCANTTYTASQGSTTIRLYANDSAGNLNGTESVTFFVDSINPLIAFIAPTEANATSKNQQFIFANVTVTETNFQNITFKLYNSTGEINATTYTTLVTTINWTNLINENVQYWYNVSTYDTVGNFNQTETRFITLTADQFPTVSIIYPQNTTYNVNVSQLNYTASDDNSLSACWYSLDLGVTNSSPDATCSNFTGLTSIEGSNNWTVYANDSIGQESSDSVTFTKDTIFPQFSSHARNPSPPNEDQSVQINVTVTELNKDTVILEFNNGTLTNYTVTTSNGDEFFYTISTGNYTAHDSVNYSWYANDTAGNLNKSSLQIFTVANQIPSVSAPALNDTTPLTNELISCDGGTFSDDDAEDAENTRYFLWYDTDVEISGQTSQTLDLTTSGLDKADTIKCSIRVYDGFDNSTFVNSSNTATIQNSAPAISNPLTTISWDANGSTFTYDYDFTDADGDSEIWYDNTTLFDINQTGYISDTPTESEAGIYAIRINVSDGTINATDDFTYTINDVTLPNIDFVSPTETNDSQLTRNYIQVNVTASDTNGIDTITLYLYNSTALVQTNTSTTSPLFVNFTGLPDETYYLNSTVNDTAGNENSTVTRTVTIDTGPPSVNYVVPTENSGVYKNQNYVEINVTASDPNLDKILIRIYNSSNDLINSSTTSSSPNFINFSNLADGLYFYNATANDTFSNENSLETRNITLDTAVPSVTSLIESPSDPATYSGGGATYQFNATITDDNLDTVLIEFDGVNYTPTQTGNVYNLTRIDLAAGIYNYYWYANDSAGNVNSTLDTYTINNATGDITLLINDSANNQTAPYTTQTNASTTTLYGSVILYRNGTDITSENNIFVTLAAGYYNYTAVSSGDQNHSSASTILFVTITRASSEVNLTLNQTDGNVTIIQDSLIYLNVTTITGDSGANLKLYNAGTLINQGSSPLSNLTTFSTIGLFNITGIYNESQNFTGSSETWWVNVTESPDLQNPSVAALTENPSDPASYSEGATYEFNATVTDNRIIDAVLIEFNGVNYTTNNFTGNIYNLTLTGLSVGVYDYRWYANDTSGNMNSTENETYTINQATPSLSLAITPSTSETYETQTTANGTGCPSQLNCTLYRDSVLVNNPETITLAVGTYNYTYNTTGNVNYTSASVSDNLTINQATGVVFTYLNNSRSNITINQFTSIYLNSTLETGAGNIKLYNNGTLINQGSSPLSNLTNFTNIGLHNITTTYDGNVNYTSAFETFFVNVLEVDIIPPNVSLIEPQNISYTLIQTQLNYTVADNQALDSCWYSLDLGSTNVTITCGQNVTGLNSGQGSSTWRIYANDTNGNENSSSVTFFVDSINPAIEFTTGTETSGSSLGRNFIQVNVTASDSNLANITIRLYNSTSDLVQENISASSSFFINYTGLTDSLYFFNSTAADTLNNQNSTDTRNVSLITPTLTIIKPENETYLTNESLLLDFTVSDENFVFYNIDNSANTTITENTTFNTTEGQHTFNLYANNSNGETRKNVTFTVNFTKFVVIHNDFSGLVKGLSTAFNQSSYEDLQNLSGIILERINAGKITFNVAINVTDNNDLTDNKVDLDTNVNISLNRIELNSTALPNFNKSATLYLYNLTFTNPRVLRDGTVCSSSICVQNSYSGGTLSFNVTQFTVYSAEETPEDVEPPPSSGGGSSKIVINFSVNIDLIDLKIKQGERAREVILIENTGDKILEFDLNVEEIEEFVILSEESFSLSSKDSKKINADFFVSEDEPGDVHAGRIIIEAGSISKSINVILEILEKAALFDVKSELVDETLVKNQKIKVKINMLNIGDVGKSVDVVLEYFINDFSGNQMKIGEETIGVYDSLDIERKLPLPTNLEPGDYLFYVKLTYLNSTATSANRFNLREGFSFSNFTSNLWLIVIILLLILFIIIKMRKAKPKLKEEMYKEKEFIALPKKRPNRLMQKIRHSLRSIYDLYLKAKYKIKAKILEKEREKEFLEKKKIEKKKKIYLKSKKVILIDKKPLEKPKMIKLFFEEKKKVKKPDLLMEKIEKPIMKPVEKPQVEILPKEEPMKEPKIITKFKEPTEQIFREVKEEQKPKKEKEKILDKKVMETDLYEKEPKDIIEDIAEKEKKKREKI